LSIKNYDNEKIFKIIGCPYLYIMAILAFSYFTSKPLPEGKKESKPNLLIKSKRLSIKKHGFYYSGFIYFYGNHHYLWDKKTI
jgi:hypothetical protein